MEALKMDNQTPGIGTQSFIKFCPACKLGNDANAVTCTYCGTPLDLILSKAARADVLSGGGYTIPENGVAFFLLGNPKPISVATDGEFVLGRKTDEGDKEAMVDLSAPDGYAMGVSRRHAMVRSTNKGYVIIDLNSSNGTWLDGKILVPTQPYDLASGNTIQLGRLKLVATFR